MTNVYFDRSSVTTLSSFFSKCPLYCRIIRSDMTFVVDWGLNDNYLSICRYTLSVRSHTFTVALGAALKLRSKLKGP